MGKPDLTLVTEAEYDLNKIELVIIVSTAASQQDGDQDKS
jgi:hypothetical protein